MHSYQQSRTNLINVKAFSNVTKFTEKSGIVLQNFRGYATVLPQRNAASYASKVIVMSYQKCTIMKKIKYFLDFS